MYLFQGKYNMLLRVDNRNDVTTNSQKSAVLVHLAVFAAVVFVFFAVSSITEPEARKVAWGYIKNMLPAARRK